jgi:hypothetical protein
MPCPVEFFGIRARRSLKTKECSNEHPPGTWWVLRIRISSIAQKTLKLHPIGKPVDPVICGKVLLSHSEAVAALGVHV